MGLVVTQLRQFDSALHPTLLSIIDNTLGYEPGNKGAIPLGESKHVSGYGS